MRRLLLMRHAKSDQHLGLPDRERPLNDRGRRTAPVVAAHLREQGWVPDRTVSSPALRTRQTVEGLGGLVAPDSVRFEDGLYAARADDVLAVVHGLHDDADTLLLVGHNPGMHDLAQRLATDGDPRDLDRLSTDFPTAAVAVLDCDARSWRDVTSGALVALVIPREL